jgi:hypothetical protein|tara:strand:- start:2062 stop:2304 length:243 start_codon:yes stop_codon:yes gene_type:complete
MEGGLIKNKMEKELYKIRVLGFERIRGLPTSQGFEIYGRGHKRIVYDPELDREVTRYLNENRYISKRGLSQVTFNGDKNK